MTALSTRVSALSLGDDARSVTFARDWLSEFLGEVGVHARCIDDAVLIVSELTSNAVRHGSGGVICEAVMLDDRTCLVSVIDFGSGEPNVVDRAIDDIGGLGLVIVERLALKWGVAQFDGGKAVYAVIDASSDAATGDSTDAVA